MGKQLTNLEFIEKCSKIHNNFYDYSKTNYTKSANKVIVICPIHGEFEIRANHHICGHGCKKCGIESRKLLVSLTTKDFILKSKSIHNNKYNYSKVDYKNSYTKVCIICPEHGEFLLTPSHHLYGKGCPKCANNITHTKEQFIELANLIHNNKYNYSKVLYTNSNTKVCIICPVHGEFWLTPSAHLSKEGCPKCNQSKGELNIENFLKNHNIKYIALYSIDIDKSINPSGVAKIDFYLPEHNLFIEYNGIQHYIPIKHFGGQLTFEHLQKRDLFIELYCNMNKVNLLIIKYSDDIEKILNKYFVGYNYNSL